VLFVRRQPAELGLDAKRFQEAGGNPADFDFRGSLRAADDARSCPDGSSRAQGARPLGDREHLGAGQRRYRLSQPWQRGPHDSQPCCVRERQGRQQHIVDDGDHQRHGGQPEREGDDNHRREQGPPPP
jgi:hypothetical protein